MDKFALYSTTEKSTPPPPRPPDQATNIPPRTPKSPKSPTLTRTSPHAPPNDAELTALRGALRPPWNGVFAAHRCAGNQTHWRPTKCCCPPWDAEFSAVSDRRRQHRRGGDAKGGGKVGSRGPRPMCTTPFPAVGLWGMMNTGRYQWRLGRLLQIASMPRKCPVGSVVRE